MTRYSLGKMLLGVGALTLGLCLVVASANAAVKPGDVIAPQNAAQIRDLVPPGVYYAVTHGMRMEIVPSERIDWPPPYRAATEKYSQQVRLTDDHRSIIGYVAGQPFPLIDLNDPYVATKIIWNNVFRPISSDDYDLRFYDCQSEYVRPGEEQRMIDDLEIGHYAGYNLVGRTEVEPMPVDPDFKQSGRLWLFALYPFLAPEDWRGQGLIRYRYADPNRGDDSWDWTPGTRRVRRLNEAILSSATGAQSYDPDHYSGFNPKTEQYNYKFLGEKQMLASVHAQHSPEVTAPTMAVRPHAPRLGSCATRISSRRHPGAIGTILVRWTSRPRSIWTANYGSSRTSTPTTRRVIYGARTSTGWPIVTARCPMPGLRSTRSIGSSSWVRLQSTRRATSRQCVTCPASTRPSANAGTSTWGLSTRISAP